MIYCPHCQKPSAGKSAQCPHCGGKLPKPKEKPRTEAYDKLKREDNKTRKQSSKPNKEAQYASTQRQEQPKIEEKPKEQPKAKVLKSAEALVGKSQKQAVQKPQKKRLMLGETLVAAGILTKEQVKEALEKQKTLGVRLGTILVQEKLITESQLVQALSHQADIRWIDISDMNLTEELLELIPLNLARNYSFVPIDTRETKSGTKVLFLAMDNPLDTTAIKAAQAASEMRIEPLFAAPSAIDAAIRIADERQKAQTKEHEIDETQELEVVQEDIWKLPKDSSSLLEPDSKKKPPDGKNVTQRQIVMVAPPPIKVGGKPKVEEKRPAPQEKRAEKQEKQVPSKPEPSQDSGAKAEKPKTLTFLDGTTIQRTVQLQTGFDELEVISQKLVSKLKELDDSPKGIPRIKQYLVAVLEILLRKKLIFPAELLDELEKLEADLEK